MSDRLFESFSFNLHKRAITHAPRIRVLSRNRRARAKTFGWMATEQLKIRSVQFGTAANVIDVTILNTGTSPVTITEIYVNNGANLLAAQFTVPANGNTTQTLDYPWIAGNQYEVEIKSSKGNQFTYTAVAPS
jgi:hypothetical protein